MKHLFSGSYWKDKDVEYLIGTLLRYGVILSSIVVFIGGIIYLINNGAKYPDYTTFKGESAELKTLPAVLKNLGNFNGKEIIQLGVMILIATPIIRIAFSAFAFLIEKDYLYVIITLLVLAVISYSMLGGLAG